MTLDAELSQSQDERLQEVIAAYLRDVEAGRNPDQAELLARHPDLAAELQDFIVGQEKLRRLAAPLRQVVEPGPDAGITGTLGDFRIVREVGRGGMGIVYEAEQISLRRRVALKVLPFAATMDARHLQRFHNEAQAAACLHHTNIVPVYFVGSERGVHFYAMQFIDGQPLSEIIRQMRRLEKKEPLASENGTVDYHPSPGEIASTPLAAEVTPLTGEGRRSRDYYRKVAELGIQAAEALDHAHQLGIVHRDIKPGNLMLDGMGRLWVTDFGLAHMQHGEASLTGTGQMVGTPRYMSPEQALAKRVPIDHRTDIYSLGVTLYELLTLRPAFASEDRNELLRQIAFEEPAKPRRLERAIPAEVETIVLKAMEKRPQDRYATAQELADDLRRFLDARPIRAQRPTLIERAQKWLRRHPGVKWAAAVVLLVVTAAAVLSTILIQREQSRTQAALAAEAKRRQQARDALDAMTSQLMEDWLSKQGAVLPEHKAFLEKALTFYEEFAADTGQDEASRAGVADAYLRVGNIRNRLGLREAAETAYVSARQLFSQLVADFPTMSAYRKGLADSYYEFGLMLSRYHQRPAAAEDALRASLALRQQLAAEFPTVPAYRFNLAFSHARLGAGLQRMDRLMEAEEAYRTSLHLREQLAREFPAVRRYRVEVAGSHIDLATLLQLTGRLKEAEQIMRGAPAVYQQYAADFPTAENRWFLAWAYNRQGNLLGDLGRLKEAEEAVRAQLAILQQLVAEFPTVVLYRESLQSAHYNLGNNLRKQGRLDEAITQVREAIRLDQDKFLSHYLLGKVLRDKGQLDESIAEFRAAVRSYRVFEEEPKLTNIVNPDLRYNAAACAAVLAGCSQGADADKLDAKERARLRPQALDWLRADLKAYRQVMEKSAGKAGPEIARRMQHWLQDGDFAGVRGDEALAKLPDEERSAWRKLWADVAEMLTKAQGKAPGEKKPDTK